MLTLCFPALFLAKNGVVDRHRMEVGATEPHNNRLFNGIISGARNKKIKSPDAAQKQRTLIVARPTKSKNADWI